ncbi:MAG: glycosyltransferase, partial [Dehalococcoidia bacterium]|nr:glycosyltransferase [Dehalococcoidia bacterium]
AAHFTLPVHEKSPASMWACVPALESIIRSAGVDLVHARSRVPAWIGWLAARHTQRPFLTTAHGFYAPHPASRIMVQGRLVIVPSVALERYLMDRFGVSRSRLRVIPRGVDLEEFTRQPARDGAPPWRLGLIGRLSPIKGHEVAIRSLARLRRQGVDARLCIAGDTDGQPLRASLDRLANELGVAEAIDWLGLRQDVPQLLASMDAVLVPSTYPESFGRGVIEAQAVGRPVVASSLGGLTELIEDGRTGVLVRPGDPESLADGLARVLTDAALRRACVEEGRRRVEQVWSLDRMVDRTLAAYEECLRRPRVLIWKISALGDVVLSTPGLRAIRRRYPDSPITMVVSRSAYDVVARCPYVTEFLIFNPKGRDRTPARRLAFIRRLRREGFDVSIDLQNS